MTRNLLELGLVDKAFNQSLTQAAVSAFDRYVMAQQHNSTTASGTATNSGGRRRRKLKGDHSQPITTIKLDPDKPTPNDQFFEHQKSRGYSVMDDNSSSHPEMMDVLRDSILMDASSVYLKECGAPENLLQQLGVLYSIDAWAAVQHGQGAYHRDHVHEDVLVSGVYYASVPEGSAPLVLQRPRECDTAEESVVVSPQAGQLIIFPPWLWHGVPLAEDSNMSPQQPRVSFAFNLSGPYAGDPWEITRKAGLSSR